MQKLATILLLATAVLAACSNVDFDHDTASSITLARVDNVSTKDTVVPRKDSIIDLDVQWQTWDGQAQSAIQVTDDSVRIVGDPNATDTVIGTHDYRIALLARAEYVLDVDDFSAGGGAALIFPYLAGGTLVAVSDDNLAIATPGNPFSFTAPEGIVGFWIQVQNKWGDPGSDATISPVLGTVSTPPPWKPRPD